jgi:NADH:ubiquinone oxidoreductase subunit C
MLPSSAGGIGIYSKIQRATGFEFDEINESLPVINIPSHQLIRVLTILSSNRDLLYKRFLDIIVIDLLYMGKQFEVDYIIMSQHYNNRLNVCIRVEEGAGVDSIENIYPAARFRENKIAQAFEITFKGNRKPERKTFR